MNLVDYTHPGRVPPMYLANDRRSEAYYVQLDELQPGHRYYSIHWALFRHPEWLEGGSAWVHAKEIFEDLERLSQELNIPVLQLRPLVGSGESSYDEALAQALITFDLKPMVAEVVPRAIAQQKYEAASTE